MSTLKRYRRRPAEVEAVQLDPQNAFDLLDEFGGELEMTDYGTPTALLFPTLGGVMRVEVGDYIVRVDDAEYYSCKGLIFEKIYEEVKQ